uniref:Tryptophan synthase beta chain-like PALP domain-containing protein n=1 Tax=Amorphochlora amoebiformis TaxID=1561963 RepID=A0A7S0DN53_9EUKA
MSRDKGDEKRLPARTVKVFSDDLLPGGTKQRGLGVILMASLGKCHLYAGPENGFAQVALAVASKACGKKAISVVSAPRKGKRHSSVQEAEKYGAEIVEVAHGKLSDVKEKARLICKRQFQEDLNSPILLPFGLDCEAFVDTLVSSLRASLPSHLVKNGPKRLWLVAGSAVLLATFHRLWPKTHFLVVQVGKKIWTDQLEGKISTKFVAKEKFYEPARISTPYPSVDTYDAKVWQFVLKHAVDGDYVWNVARDPPPML